MFMYNHFFASIRNGLLSELRIVEIFLMLSQLKIFIDLMPNFSFFFFLLLIRISLKNATFAATVSPQGFLRNLVKDLRWRITFQPVTTQHDVIH